jgi:hypothetical protein
MLRISEKERQQSSIDEDAGTKEGQRGSVKRVKLQDAKANKKMKVEDRRWAAEKEDTRRKRDEKRTA